MLGRNAFVLIAAALVAGGMAVYASFRETRFFPESLQTTMGQCPGNGDVPAHRRPVLREDEAAGLGRQLQDLHEEPLARAAEGRRTLRFSILDVGVRSVTVRVAEVEGGRLHLTARWPRGTGLCANDRGCIVQKRLSPAEQARLEAAVEPLLRVPSYGCDGPVDSSGALLEASDGASYRMWLQRSSPNEDLGAAAEVFLQLAEWPLADEVRMTVSHP